MSTPTDVQVSPALVKCGCIRVSVNDTPCPHSAVAVIHFRGQQLRICRYHRRWTAYELSTKATPYTINDLRQEVSV